MIVVVYACKLVILYQKMLAIMFVVCDQAYSRPIGLSNLSEHDIVGTLCTANPGKLVSSLRNNYE